MAMIKVAAKITMARGAFIGVISESQTDPAKRVRPRRHTEQSLKKFMGKITVTTQ
jgi:hypothetical protein